MSYKLTNILETLLIGFYVSARNIVLKDPWFQEQYEWQQSVSLKEQTEESFFHNYVWVVLCSGFKMEYAQKIMQQFKLSNDFNVIRHPMKKKAVMMMDKMKRHTLEKIKSFQNDEDVLDFLETLPHIGEITKYHLAKNIGLDVPKPDVHLRRLARFFFHSGDYKEVYSMCKIIKNNIKYNDRIATIDLVLWRFCERRSDYLELLKRKRNEMMKTWE